MKNKSLIIDIFDNISASYYIFDIHIIPEDIQVTPTGLIINRNISFAIIEGYFNIPKVIKKLLCSIKKQEIILGLNLLVNEKRRFYKSS
jgi:hypothetical protein